MIEQRGQESSANGEGEPVVGRRNAFAGHLARPPEAGTRPQPGSPTAGSGPPVATTQDGERDGRRRDWRLPATESSVTVLRRGLSDFLRGAALSDEERYDLLLAACEAASNAIEHAGDPSEPFFEVVATIGDAGVTIIVCDRGQWRDVVPGVHRGRGMAMMWILADTTVVSRPQGTTVTIRSSPRHGRSPVPPHGEPGAAEGSRRPSFGLRGHERPAPGR